MAPTPNPTKLPNQVISYWRSFLFIGIILIILGFFSLSFQFLSTFFIIDFIGVLLLIAGFAQAFHSFKTKGLGRSATWAIMGIIYMIVGIYLIIQPVAASTAVTLIFSLLLIVGGITQIIGAFNNKNFPKWGWLLLSGIITLMLGFVIILGWPEDSLWVLGMFLGIDLIFQGWAYVAIGMAIKSSKQ